MRLAKTTKIVLIVVAGIIVITYGVLAFLSGNFDLMEILKFVAAFVGGTVTGVASASRKKIS